MYVCECDCGKRSNVYVDSLLRGGTTSCGCVRNMQTTERSLKHGHSRHGLQTKTYRAWQSMLRRCNNPNDRDYEAYGGRGITVCDRWQGKGGFENFLADMGEKPRGRTIERLNNNGDYSPDNCKWATSTEQNNNKRNNIMIWDGSQYVTMSQYATRVKIPYPKLQKLIRLQPFAIKRRAEIQ